METEEFSVLCTFKLAIVELGAKFAMYALTVIGR